MKGLVIYASDYNRIVQAMNALDAGKRYAPKMTASKRALLTAIEVLIIPRLNAGMKAHTFTISDVAEAAHESTKTARLAVGLAKAIKFLIPVEEAKFDPSTGKTMPGRYMVNFHYIEETLPRTVSSLRLAMIRCGAYGENFIDASVAVDRQLESFRLILEERGIGVLTVRRVIELLVEVEGKRWERVVRSFHYWKNWAELS